MLTVAATEAIRAHFPALSRVHDGFPVAYFDGPGGTQVPRQVGDAMLDYLYHHNANTHWAYPSSAETDAALDGAREAFGDFLNASPDEISFGANMTTLTLHVFVSHGDFYAMTVIERLGLADSGLVRAGCGIYTTADEVSRLIEGVERTAAQ